MWQAVAIGGLIFGSIAAAMAFLITYEEYSHHYGSRAEVCKQALQMAGATLAFFLLLSLAVGGVFTVAGRIR